MAKTYEDDDAGAGAPQEQALWVEQPAERRRMPDTVRRSAVRAVLIVAVTLTVATITFFLTVTGSWLALPLSLVAIAGTVVATWGVLDVLITRQTWNQRYGVVSEPSSTARDRRRERRRVRREARAAPGAPVRQPERIPGRGEAVGIWPPPSGTGRG
ncbi:hypothetical protein [Streptomyces sp. H34-S4]|uniref:hypothetical protein n=1 Tax=Streptomyces sp. H34-S4 TaxID=2996463 RepID=UPI0022714DDE|nr:hypothetical protein [Streptomyces sp. H34-S4]MCY0938493.1 hypothetical protein [Streptomyces sp. H34-S4]